MARGRHAADRRRRSRRPPSVTTGSGSSTAVGTADAPVYVVVSAEGRYLVDDDGLVGAAGDDPLVAELAALSVDELTARIAALPTPTG